MQRVSSEPAAARWLALIELADLLPSTSTLAPPLATAPAMARSWLLVLPSETLVLVSVLHLQALALGPGTATSWRRRWPASPIWSVSVRSCAMPPHARTLCWLRAGGVQLPC